MAKITETKKVVHEEIKEVLVGRTCDFCKKPIEKDKYYGFNYFVVHTWHNDWGNDSIDSHEYMDACCAECALKFATKYIQDAFARPINSHEIEIKHVRSLEEGAENGPRW